MSALIRSYLILENGTVFSGFSPEWQKKTYDGEVVFTTGMTGYPESLTDPSYSRQLLTFTYPLIGNYGVPPSNLWESTKIWAKGIIVGESCQNWSHHQGVHSLAEWMKIQNIPMISGVDTRALTKLLRTSGTMLGAISPQLKKKINFSDPNIEHLAGQASISTPKTYGNGKKKVIAIDCGMKENIIRTLMRFPLTIKRVPHHYDLSCEDFDGLFISNGPGDPTTCKETIRVLQKAILKKKPIFGICLGTQLLALAAGAKTYKLPFGHRGQNQPCINLSTKQCFITSQNHGYAVDERSLPKGWKVTFKNLNDGSVEGIEHSSLPYFAVQFHPEANPGPTDTAWLFEKFYKLL